MTKEQFEYIKAGISRLNDAQNPNELVVALTDLYESSQWRPISEAPRDGTRVELVITPWAPDKRWVTVGRWIADVNDIAWDDYEPDDWEPGWFEDPVEIERVARIFPTLYRPIPKLPTEQTNESNQ